jgi:hypothetical protein
MAQPVPVLLTASHPTSFRGKAAGFEPGIPKLSCAYQLKIPGPIVNALPLRGLALMIAPG